MTWGTDISVALEFENANRILNTGNGTATITDNGVVYGTTVAKNGLYSLGRQSSQSTKNILIGTQEALIKSVSFWVYPNNNGLNYQSCAFSFGISNNFFMIYNYGTAQTSLYFFNQTPFWQSTPLSTITNNWNSVQATFNNGTFKAYINGTLGYTKSTTLVPNGFNLYVANSVNSNIGYQDSIDDFTLSSLDLQGIMPISIPPVSTFRNRINFDNINYNERIIYA